MTIAAVGGQAGKTTDPTFALTSLSRAFGSNVSTGSLITVIGFKETDASTVWSAGDCTKLSGTATIGSVSLDKALTVNVEGGDYVSVGIWSALVTSSGSLTMQIAASGGSYRGLTIITDEYTGTFDASRLETSASSSTTSDSQTTASTGNATSAGGALFVGGFCDYSANNTAIGQDAAFTVIAEEENGASFLRGSAIRRIVTTGTTDSADWTMDSSNFGWVACLAVYKEAGGGVSVNITGASSSSAVGSLTETGFANVTLTGAASTSAAGIPTVSGKANVSVTGVSATSSANVPTITAAANVFPTGVVGTSTANVPTVSGKANVTLSGVAATGSAGDVTVSVGGATSVNLTGVASTTAAGTPTVTGLANVALTGVSSTASAGALTAAAAANASVTGVQSASAAGTPNETGAANVTLSGVLATCSAGDITVSVPTAVSVNLTGVSALGQAGTPTTNLDIVDTTRGSETILTDRRGVGEYFSRKKYEEILEAEAAIAAAEAKAKKLKAKPKRALVRAAEAAQEAIKAVGLLDGVAPPIEPITEALQAATAARASEVVALANEAREMAERVIAEFDDDEEEIMLMIWAMQ